MTVHTHTPDLDFCSGLLCIELDLQARPLSAQEDRLLTEAGTNILADHLINDLNRLLEGGIEPAGLVLAGALYDQTDIFRPGFPLLTTLANRMRRALRSNGLPLPRLALGTNGNRFLIEELNPRAQTASSPLVLLPFCLVGPGEVLDRLFVEMEHCLASGEVSAETQSAVENLFGVSVVNLFYATLGDLCAWLRTQLADNDLHGLWQLLEPALFERPGPHQVVLREGGNRYVLFNDIAWAPFYTFDAWANDGPGKTLPPAQLEEGYRRWLRQFRLYATALPAYGLPLRLVASQGLVECDDAATAWAALQAAPRLEGDYLVETVRKAPPGQAPKYLLATQHGDAALKVIAYSFATTDEKDNVLSLEHFYPLHTAGLDAIVAEIERRSQRYGLPCPIQHPGWMVCSPTDRCLGVVGHRNQVLIAS